MFVAGVVVGSAGRLGDEAESFLIQIGTKRLSFFIAEVLLVSSGIRDEEFSSNRITDTDGVRFDSLFCYHFRRYFWIDPEIRCTVGEYDDNLLTFLLWIGISTLFEHIGRDEESVAHGCSGESWNRLVDRVGRDVFDRIFYRIIVECEWSGEEWFPSKEYHSDPVGDESIHERGEHFLGCLDPVRFHILSEHGF